MTIARELVIDPARGVDQLRRDAGQVVIAQLAEWGAWAETCKVADEVRAQLAAVVDIQVAAAAKQANAVDAEASARAAYSDFIRDPDSILPEHYVERLRLEDRLRSLGAARRQADGEVAQLQSRADDLIRLLAELERYSGRPETVQLRSVLRIAAG